MYENIQVDNDLIIVDRINEYIKSKKVRKTDLSSTMGWQLSKLSKILSKTQKPTYKDLLDITAAMGFPLEAFMQEDFDLVRYEKENDPMPLTACFEMYKESYPAEDVIEEMIATEIPYAIRKVLNLNMNMFSFRTETNSWNVPKLVNVENDYGIRYSPVVTIRPQGMLSKWNDYLELGYWFSKNEAAALAITFVPDLSKREPGKANMRREFYKGLVEGLDTKGYDNPDGRRFVFDTKLNHAEICSIIYDFSNNVSELQLENDLLNMFKVYKNLILEASERMEQFFWEANAGENLLEPMVMGDVNVEYEAKEACGYKCFVDQAHYSFEDNTGHDHVECIFVIPLNYQEEFNEDLDCVENIVCLCPMCYSKFFYAKDSEREQMMVDIYYKKKAALADKGFDISLAQMLKMHNFE